MSYQILRTIIVRLCIVLIIVTVACLNTAAAPGTGLSVTSLTAKDGLRYRLYGKNGLDITWETKRPDKNDEKTKLCIPAAFTTTSDTIVGIYAVRGELHNIKQISRPIGGAILIRKGQFTIFPSANGARFTEQFLRSVEKDKASFFQQFQLVENGKPAHFKDKKIFQMRALAKFFDGREGVVESENAISFQQFNRDLAELGVQDALYTDMGAWDEGWYRDPVTAGLVAIGNDRSKTNKQTNWLTFRSRD